jgi:hypothetical protein
VDFDVVVVAGVQELLEGAIAIAGRRAAGARRAAVISPRAMPGAAQPCRSV